jgi:hypothetical protein
VPPRSENFRTITGAHSIENETGKISIFAHPVLMTNLTAELRTPGHGVRAARLPDESRYGENGGKNCDEVSCSNGPSRVFPHRGSNTQHWVSRRQLDMPKQIGTS